MTHVWFIYFHFRNLFMPSFLTECFAGALLVNSPLRWRWPIVLYRVYSLNLERVFCKGRIFMTLSEFSLFFSRIRLFRLNCQSRRIADINLQECCFWWNFPDTVRSYMHSPGEDANLPALPVDSPCVNFYCYTCVSLASTLLVCEYLLSNCANWSSTLNICQSKLI